MYFKIIEFERNSFAIDSGNFCNAMDSVNFWALPNSGMIKGLVYSISIALVRINYEGHVITFTTETCLSLIYLNFIRRKGFS